MNAKQQIVFAEACATFKAQHQQGNSDGYYTSFAIQKENCERIVNAVIEAGVPEIEWQLDGEKTDDECKDWQGIVNGSAMLEVWEDEEEQWLVTGIGASDKYRLSLHGRSFAEAKSAAEQVFRAWWLKAQGEPSHD